MDFLNIYMNDYIKMSLSVIFVFFACYCLFYNYRLKKSGQTHFSWVIVYRCTWLLALLFAWASQYVYFKLAAEDGVYTFVGFPFTVGVFDPKGLDYVGKLSTLYVVINAVIFSFFAPVIVFLASFIKKKTSLRAGIS